MHTDSAPFDKKECFFAVLGGLKKIVWVVIKLSFLAIVGILRLVGEGQQADNEYREAQEQEAELYRAFHDDDHPHYF